MTNAHDPAGCYARAMPTGAASAQQRTFYDSFGRVVRPLFDSQGNDDDLRGAPGND
jgi:hypothetical protein